LLKQLIAQLDIPKREADKNGIGFCSHALPPEISQFIVRKTVALSIRSALL